MIKSAYLAIFSILGLGVAGSAAIVLPYNEPDYATVQKVKVSHGNILDMGAAVETVISTEKVAPGTNLADFGPGDALLCKLDSCLGPLEPDYKIKAGERVKIILS